MVSGERLVWGSSMGLLLSRARTPSHWDPTQTTKAHLLISVLFSFQERFYFFLHFHYHNFPSTEKSHLFKTRLQ